MKLNKVIVYIILSIVILYTMKYITLSIHTKIIPKTREEMKYLLEKTKSRKCALFFNNSNNSNINNRLSREIYLPESWYAADFKQDPNMTLPYDLKTQCFWVVSRANNCYYCLGHQEHKLSLIGFTDLEIATLDYSWKSFDKKTSKALELARKITLSPHTISDEDIDILHPEFNDNEIIELVFIISMFNSVNRWTDGILLPQDTQMKGATIDFSRQVSNEFKNNSMPLCIRKTMTPRQLPTVKEIIEFIKIPTSRKCRVRLVSVEDTSKLLDLKPQEVDDLTRVLATFPTTGKYQYNSWKSMETQRNIDEKTRLIIRWTVSRHNMALFSLNQIYKNISLLDYNLEDIENPSYESNIAVKIFTIKLTEYPQFIDNNDIKILKKYFNDIQIAEIIYLISSYNMFDRLTESLGCSY